MKTIKVFALFLFLAPIAISSAQSSLEIEMVDFRNNKGVVIVALLDTQEKDVMDKTTKISDKKCVVKFEGVKNGQYAIRLIHDENQNNELDTNFLGIPKEGFGFSNDAMGKFGPKDFEEWLFDVSGDTKIKITANYIRK